LVENPDDPTMLLGIAKAEGTGSDPNQAFLRKLVRINVETGAVTDLGSLGAHMADLAFIPVPAVPSVAEVYVRGTAWAPEFMSYIESGPAVAGNTTPWPYGAAAYGVKLAANPTANDTVSWINTNQVVLRYSGPLGASGLPSAASIILDGEDGDYAVTNVEAIDDRTVKLTLNRSLGSLPGGGIDGDRVVLTVPGAGPAGGNFTRAINVLQGDTSRSTQGRVNANDQGYVKSRLNRSTAAPTSGAQAAYNIFADVDGSGRINANDQGAVKSRLNDSLPTSAFPAGIFSATRIAEEVLA
jgi:hypothetical protein